MQNKKISLLIPMSGTGSRYLKAGYDGPKPLIPVGGRPMIERLLRNFPENWSCYFVLSDAQRNTELPALLKKLRPQSRTLYIPPHKQGPSFACLKALEIIPEDAPVLVSYCDYGMVWDPVQFEEFVSSTNCDACLVSYRGFHAHYNSPTTYAYSRMSEGRVVEVKEKGSFTKDRTDEFASNGAYYFRSAGLLKAAIDHQMKLNLQLNGEYYTSLTVQALLQLSPKSLVNIFEIPYFFQWGTPEDLRAFEFWESSFKAKNAFSGKRCGRVAQLLMPMAGGGTRFRDITSLPKPLIPIDGTPMYQAALDSLPQATTVCLVALSSFANLLKATPSTKILKLEKTPPGQALSTEEGLKGIGLQKEVLVSACDHAVCLNPEKWNAFQQSPKCDVAIFTITGFPGADQNPNTLSYVLPENSSDQFPMVRAVGVKKPFTSTPSKEFFLVGTFWFRTGSVLERGIELVKRHDLRVNGELYLDSAMELLMKEGLSIRMIPLDGYIGWGDPNSLSEALYWQEVFGGRRITKRLRFPGVPT